MKFSSEPPTAALFFVENSRRRDSKFRARLEIRSRSTISSEIDFFLIVGPSGNSDHGLSFLFSTDLQ